MDLDLLTNKHTHPTQKGNSNQLFLKAIVLGYKRIKNAFISDSVYQHNFLINML